MFDVLADRTEAIGDEIRIAFQRGPALRPQDQKVKIPGRLSAMDPESSSLISQ